MANARILILDADLKAAELLATYIKSLFAFEVYCCTTTRSLENLLETKAFCLVFIDIETFSASEVFQGSWKMLDPRCRLVLVHREYDEWVAVLMEKLKADYFFMKPFEFKELALILLEAHSLALADAEKRKPDVLPWNKILPFPYSH